MLPEHLQKGQHVVVWIAGYYEVRVVKKVEPDLVTLANGAVMEYVRPGAVVAACTSAAPSWGDVGLALT